MCNFKENVILVLCVLGITVFCAKAEDGHAATLDPFIRSCANIWTQLDLVRAIKQSERERVACMERITESFLLLYEPLTSKLTKDKLHIHVDSALYLREMCEAIRMYLEDIYHASAHESFVCSRVVITKIMGHLAACSRESRGSKII